jgi:hypothetical protein
MQQDKYAYGQLKASEQIKGCQKEKKNHGNIIANVVCLKCKKGLRFRAGP